MSNTKRSGRSRVKILSGVAAVAIAAGLAGAAPVLAADVGTTPTIQNFPQAHDDDSSWILTGKGYDNNRYVADSTITPDNVKNLKPVWTFKIDDHGPIEATPMVWHGTIYISSAHDHIYAIDAKTGQLKWQFQDDPHVISFAANRGVTLLDGKVYIGTLDGHLIALDAETGQKVFDVLAVEDPSNSFYSAVPIPYHNPTTGKDQLLLGVSNGDWGGLGNISAFDPDNGKRIWQFNTVPGPGEKATTAGPVIPGSRAVRPYGRRWPSIRKPAFSMPMAAIRSRISTARRAPVPTSIPTR